MTVYIYGLVNPNTKEIVYIGQAKESIVSRIKSHYWKLNEVKRGKRKWTKVFHYLDDLLPQRTDVEILKILHTDEQYSNPDFWESYFIKKYRQINPNLLNETDGGSGGNTMKYKTEQERFEAGQKISNKLKGKPKPEGFAEHLRAIRLGKNNPMAKPLSKKIACYHGLELVKVFSYSYEIDEYLGKKGAYSNVVKALTKMPNFHPYGYKWKYFEG